MGPGGPVALDMLAVELAMNYYHIDQEERIEFSLKVRKIANIVFTLQAEDLAQKMKQK